MKFAHAGMIPGCVFGFELGYLRVFIPCVLVFEFRCVNCWCVCVSEHLEKYGIVNHALPRRTDGDGWDIKVEVDGCISGQNPSSPCRPGFVSQQGERGNHSFRYPCCGWERCLLWKAPTFLGWTVPARWSHVHKRSWYGVQQCQDATAMGKRCRSSPGQRWELWAGITANVCLEIP